MESRVTQEPYPNMKEIAFLFYKLNVELEQIIVVFASAFEKEFEEKINKLSLSS